MHEAELKLQIVKGQAICNECEAMYNVMKHEGKCPGCGSREKMKIEQYVELSTAVEKDGNKGWLNISYSSFPHQLA